MVKTQKFSSEAIIAAAREVFLEQGPGASTNSVAKAAGVSEGLIFKRFGTKHCLFLKAMGIPELDIRQLLEEKVESGKEIRAILTELSLEMLTFFQTVFPRLMMNWSQHNISNIKDIHADTPGPMVESVMVISSYLEKEMNQGHLAKIDPLIVARTIVGSIGNYVLWEIVGLDKFVPLNGHTFVSGMIDTIWCGLAPKSGQ